MDKSAVNVGTTSDTESGVFVLSFYTTLCWSQSGKSRQTRHVVIIESFDDQLYDFYRTSVNNRQRTLSSLPTIDQRHTLLLNYEFIMTTKRVGSDKAESFLRSVDAVERSLRYVALPNDDPATNAYCEKLRLTEPLSAHAKRVFPLIVSESNLHTWSAVYRDQLNDRRASNGPIYDCPGPPIAVGSGKPSSARNSCDLIRDRVNELLSELE